MSDQEFKSVVMLKSDQFDFSCVADVPAGEDIARFIMRAMSDRGMALPDNPIRGESGWSWTARVGDLDYHLFVQWAPIGQPSEDRWILQTDIEKGLMRNLVGRKAQPAELAPVCDALHQVLDTNPAFSAVEWLSDDEFRKVY